MPLLMLFLQNIKSNAHSLFYLHKFSILKHPVLFVTGCLQVERASQVNEGNYTMVATNSFGEVNNSIHAEFHKGRK